MSDGGGLAAAGVGKGGSRRKGKESKDEGGERRCQPEG